MRKALLYSAVTVSLLLGVASLTLPSQATTLTPTSGQSLGQPGSGATSAQVTKKKKKKKCKKKSCKKPAYKALQVSVGGAHACMIRANRTLWCWGANRGGQLGIGTRAPSLSTATPLPKKVGKAKNWKYVTAGGGHTCAIRTNGAGWCWGHKDIALGTGTSGHQTRPKPILGGHSWLSLDAGQTNTCGIASNNTLWCWGWNGSGQVGDGTDTNRRLPTRVGIASDWIQVSVGSHHTCGLRAGGSAWCWGEGGQLGNGVSSDSNVPTAVVSTGSPWLQFSAGGYHTCGIKADQSMWCWGNGANGELGTGSYDNELVPTRVGLATDWVPGSLDVGTSHSCANRSTSGAFCWGSNLDGELGDNTRINRSVPRPVATGGNFTSLALGPSNSCGLRSNQTVWCWGFNLNGQLGNGSRRLSKVPVRVR